MKKEELKKRRTEILNELNELLDGKNDTYIAKEFAKNLDNLFDEISENKTVNVAQIEDLIQEFKDEELPDSDVPFHHEAEIAAGMSCFIAWLHRKYN